MSSKKIYATIDPIYVLKDQTKANNSSSLVCIRSPRETKGQWTWIMGGAPVFFKTWDNIRQGFDMILDHDEHLTYSGKRLTEEEIMLSLDSPLFSHRLDENFPASVIRA